MMTDEQYQRLRRGVEVEKGPHEDPIAHLVKRMARGALMGSIQGYNVPIANVSCLHDKVLGDIMVLEPQYSFAACYSDTLEGRVWRIKSSGKVDCGAIARNFAGRGDRYNGLWVQIVGYAHLIQMGPPLLRIDVEHDEG